MSLTASDQTSLANDLATANGTASGTVTIDVTNNITLSSTLPAISLHAGVTADHAPCPLDLAGRRVSQAMGYRRCG